jgi:hypothetical protein
VITLSNLGEGLEACLKDIYTGTLTKYDIEGKVWLTMEELLVDGSERTNP